MSDHMSPDGMRDDAREGGRVGIFWGLRDGTGSKTILKAGVELAEAEAYGEALTFPEGHYEVWGAWCRLRNEDMHQCGLPLVLREHEYDEVPRGRIIYETHAKRFILYADRKLQTPEFVDRIKAEFGLTDASVLVRSDAHYRTLAGA